MLKSYKNPLFQSRPKQVIVRDGFENVVRNFNTISQLRSRKTYHVHRSIPIRCGAIPQTTIPIIYPAHYPTCLG
jgi:hypothetical protein